MNIATILALLPKVGPVIAALPEFKRLVTEIIDSFDSERDQVELREAYELAISNAANAHQQLQDAVKRHGA